MGASPPACLQDAATGAYDPNQPSSYLKEAVPFLQNSARLAVLDAAVALAQQKGIYIEVRLWCVVRGGVGAVLSSSTWWLLACLLLSSCSFAGLRSRCGTHGHSPTQQTQGDGRSQHIICGGCLLGR